MDNKHGLWKKVRTGNYYHIWNGLMVISGLSCYCWMVRFTLLLICTHTVHGNYNLLNSIWQTHATVDLCVSVFSNDMHSSSLGARPGGFLCRHKLSSQCALHKHHNLNNLGIRQEIWQSLFRKIDFQIHKNLRLVF